MMRLGRCPEECPSLARWLIIGAMLIVANDWQASASSSAGQTAAANSVGALQFPSNHQTSDSPPNQTNKNKSPKLGAGEAPSMNLIPVDQPLGSSGAHKRAHSIVFEDEASFNVAPISDEPAGQLEPLSVQEPSSGALQLDHHQMVGPPVEQHKERQNVLFESSADSIYAGHHDQPDIDDKSTPRESARSKTGAASSAYAHAAHSAQLSPVERRFGLFKKHHSQPAPSHYGAPQPLISAINYAAGNSYMSDCERCMVSLNGANQLSGALQESPLEPSVTPSTPAVLPVQPPSPMPMPMPQPGYSHPPAYPYQHPLAPLKNKLLMKFPFFVKSGMHNELHPGYMPVPPPPPMASSNDYSWHYQPARPSPQMSNALYLKPTTQATTAYHCVQAYGPLLQPAQQFGGPFLGTSQQETSNVVSVSPGPSKTAAHQQQQSAKQYHHHHQQQQQQQQLTGSSY